MSSLVVLILIVQCLVLLRSSLGVRLDIQDKHVVLDNGILEVTLSNPEGVVTGIRYNGIENLLEVRNEEIDRGYWDLVWSGPNTRRKKGNLDRMLASNMTVITEQEDQVEISFTRTWDSSNQTEAIPIKFDKRFIMRNGSSGFYTYAIFEHLDGWPVVNIGNIRMAFKLNKDKFHYMAIADNTKRYMPLPDDRESNRSKALDYPEAVLLTNPIEPEFKGEVDDKYQYSCETKDIKVHGWISPNPPTGMWQITPSNEFRSAGPTKQFMTSHVGPTSLNVLHSTHYAGADLIMKLADGEPWKKVFGPIFVYVNSLSAGGDFHDLWHDANNQTRTEVKSWPYDFVASEDFQPSDRRGNVSGRLVVHDRYVSDEKIPANGSYVGLASPGDAGSWQRECKGYQFWTKANEDGTFTIDNVRSGSYNIYAWVPGFIGDYKYDTLITINPGSNITLDNLVYEAPRDGPTLWEIGMPDRSAKEFYIPDPNPNLINRLYVNHSDRFRQYGLWARYSELYPTEDMVYKVGSSDYRKDWFFAQVTRKKSDNAYQGTTWQIKFILKNVSRIGTYKLRIALATANVAQLEVRVNGALENPPLFSTGEIGKDNTIARHGIHGLYWLYSVDVPGKLLVDGNYNIIFLTQTLAISPFQGIMYDYIRLEAPPSSTF